MNKLATVITRLSMMQIDENALLHDVVKQLRGREAFLDVATDIVPEAIYHGDVFEAILGDLSEMEGSPLYPSEKTISQLEELSKVVSADYIMVINRK